MPIERWSGLPTGWSLGAPAAAVLLLGGAAASAQPADDAPPPPVDDERGEHAIVVTAPRGSAITDVPPIAEFDADAVAAMGATTMGDVLRTIRGTTQGADGSDPIYLLNAQRVSGYQEIGSLPPEALEKIEVLPEQTALRFGYPPTRRVVNFITKRRFRQIELRAAAGTLTRGGSSTIKANAGLTHLRDDSRTTLALEYRHTDPLLQSDRHIAPDPDVPFDALGNVTGTGGGEIDPALSAAAGEVVTIAPVPEAQGDRDSLAGFAAGANRPRLFDIGPYRTMLADNDGFKAETVLADRIGETMAGSVSLSAEQVRDRMLAGPATARLVLPATNPYSPFTVPVVLNRYLTEVAPLAQHQTTTTLHAGATVRGALAGWQWDFTGALDQRDAGGSSQRRIDPGPANAAIAAGADPFAPFDPALLVRLTDRAGQRTRSANAKTVATNTPIELPAGAVTVTATVEAEGERADSFSRGSNTFELHLSRSRIEGGLAVDVPLASRRAGVLGFVGELSVNASFNAREVSGFGGLHDLTYGLAWGPLPGVQLLATAKRSAAAPDMTALSTPAYRVPNVPVYDLTNASTELVTVIQGGNPNLTAMHRESWLVTLNLKPFATREWRLAATYEETQIRDQTGTVYAITPQTEALLPDLFVRDPSGRLVSVTYQPTNFAFERQRTLTMTLSANGRLGKMPPPPPPGATAGVRQGPSYYGGIGPTVRFLDRLQLRPGAPELDLLHGDTINGGGLARVSGYFYGGLNYNGFGATFDGWYGGPTRVDGVTPADDLHFSSVFRLNLAVYAPVHRLFQQVAWTKGMQLRLDVSNATDHRQRVVDAGGTVPNRYQSDYLDPTGRAVTLTLRKFL